MENSVNGWIDIPVVDAIDYFSGVLQSFMDLAVHYAQFIGLVGLCWSAFKLVNSRFTVKDFWWDTFYRWLLFLLLMNLYVPISIGISVIGNKIGINAGSGKQQIITSLTNMKTSIEKDLAQEREWEESLQKDLKSSFDNLELPPVSDGQSYGSYISSVYDAVNGAKFSSKDQKKAAKARVDEYKSKKADQSIYGARTLKAINSVLIERNIDGEEEGDLTDSYIDLNIWLRDAEGNESYYISPSALLRVAALGCQIMWEQNMLYLTAEKKEIDANKDYNFVEKSFEKLSVSLPNMILSMLCCACLIICTIFSDIQYLMCIIEYTIVTGIGAFFIPFILFDGTKDLPRKLVPVFLGFVMKMIVMNIIMFFIFNELIVHVVQIMTDDAGMNWVTFAGQIFFCFIAFILAANVPKIAQTILTGQPQLSMGEFVQMASTIAGGAMASVRAARAGAGAVKETGRRTAQAAVDTAGGITKAVSAGRAASSAVRASGGTSSQAARAAASGVFATATGDLKDKVQNMGNSFLHGGGKGGSGGGGASGSPGSSAHQRSGQKSRIELPEGESRTLNASSNPHFQSATRFDRDTNSFVAMRTSEFLAEKKSQGEGVGKAAAERVMAAAEKKSQAKAASEALPDSLTGSSRGS